MAAPGKTGSAPSTACTRAADGDSGAAPEAPAGKVEAAGAGVDEPAGGEGTPPTAAVDAACWMAAAMMVGVGHVVLVRIAGAAAGASAGVREEGMTRRGGHVSGGAVGDGVVTVSCRDGEAAPAAEGVAAAGVAGGWKEEKEAEVLAAAPAAARAAGTEAAAAREMVKRCCRMSMFCWVQAGEARAQAAGTGRANQRGDGAGCKPGRSHMTDEAEARNERAGEGGGSAVGWWSKK